MRILPTELREVTVAVRMLRSQARGRISMDATVIAVAEAIKAVANFAAVVQAQKSDAVVALENDLRLRLLTRVIDLFDKIHPGVAQLAAVARKD